MLILSDASTCRHIPLYSISLFWSVCAMRLAHCNLLWMRFKFFLFVRMFCELVQNHFMISASFWAVVVYSLSLSVSDDPLPAAAQKPKRNSREWNRSSFSFERVLLRLATLSNIICVPHVRLVVPYDLCSVCVCVCVGIHICKIHTSLSSIFAVINCKWCKSYSLSLVPLVHVWVVPRAPQLSLLVSKLSRLPQGLHTASTHAHICEYVWVHICM